MILCVNKIMTTDYDLEERISVKIAECCLSVQPKKEWISLQKLSSSYSSPPLYENRSNSLIIFMLRCARNHGHGGYWYFYAAYFEIVILAYLATNFFIRELRRSPPSRDSTRILLLVDDYRHNQNINQVLAGPSDASYHLISAIFPYLCCLLIEELKSLRVSHNL